MESQRNEHTRSSFLSYIPPTHLHHLNAYKYRGVDESILGRLFLNDFWNRAVTFLPLWLA